MINKEFYVILKDLFDELDVKYELGGNCFFYFVMVLNFFGIIVSCIKFEGFVDIDGFYCLIIEKLFGYDLVSVEELNNLFC